LSLELELLLDVSIGAVPDRDDGFAYERRTVAPEGEHWKLERPIENHEREIVRAGREGQRGNDALAERDRLRTLVARVKFETRGVEINAHASGARCALDDLTMERALKRAVIDVSDAMTRCHDQVFGDEARAAQPFA
jgi:hypothetical protein